MIIEIIIFVIFLGIILFLHEAGHFFVAKWFGVKVEEFGIGYPPRIWKKEVKGTIYSINLLPFGGFVKILGEDIKKEGEEDEEKSKNFRYQKFYKKFSILFAGVFINFLAGAIFLSAGFMVGLPSVSDESLDIKDAQLSILAVDNDSPAEESGLKPGDIIIQSKVGDDILESPISVDAFKNFVDNHRGEKISLLVSRPGGDDLELSVLARENPPNGKGAMGVAIGEVGIAKYGFFNSIWRGIRGASITFINTFKAIYFLIAGLFRESGVVGQLLGPVGIAVMGGQSVELGIGYLLQFLAILSINLAALNLIPFPALDGSRILFALLEKIKGRAISSKIEGIFHASGFLAMIGLLIFITIRDVIRLF